MSDLRAPSANRSETLQHDRKWIQFYNLCPKIYGHYPKNLGAKNVQNLARFQMTWDFNREYLRNGSRYRQSKNGGIKNQKMELSTTIPPTFDEKNKWTSSVV